MKIIDGHDVIEHAEVNGEDRAFIRKLTDYIEDADVVGPTIEIDADQLAKLLREGWTIHSEPKQEWIPCSERLPKINQNVLLSTTNGTVFVGHRDKPDLIWQVTESDGRKHWVYDPEAYTDDVDALPKGEDCGFSTNTDYADGFTSVTSLNYDDRFIGVNAWMPLPMPWKGADDE